MEPLVVYIFDRPGGFQGFMEKELDAKGIERLPVEIPAFTWGNRIKMTMQVAAKHPDRPLFFIDAWDTLCLGEKWELDNERWRQGITFASEKRCWPDNVETMYNVLWEYKCISRWRYLNSNPMAGMGRDIARAIEWGWERFPLKGATNDVADPEGNVCERFYTQLMFNAPREWGITVDTDCVLGQTVVEGKPYELAVEKGRIKNLITGTYPVFFHLNGCTPFDLTLLEDWKYA